MKFSTRARYGLRLCFLMAIAESESVSLSTLVKQTGLSEKYLEKLLSKLKSAGVIDAKRGKTGGYRLAKPPEQISINEVLCALDDGFEVSDCASGTCSDVYCPNKPIFRRIYESVNGFLDSFTLKDMIADHSCV